MFGNFEFMYPIQQWFSTGFAMDAHFAMVIVMNRNFSTQFMAGPLSVRKSGQRFDPF